MLAGKDLYRTLHQRKLISQSQWNEYEDWKQQNYAQKRTQKRWEELFQEHGTKKSFLHSI